MPLSHIAIRPDLNAGAVTDMQGLRDLKARASQGAPEALQAVAEQFEALFLSMMLDSMREATVDGGLGTSGESGLYQQLFDRQVAANIAEGRSMGIARQLVQQLAGVGAPPQDARAVPGARPAAQPVQAAAQPAAAPEATRRGTRGQFIRDLLPHAKRAAEELGIHPMALVAQAALETGWGGRLPRRADGASSHNLFGVKAGQGWQGQRASTPTLEFEGGLPVRRRQQFRAYESLSQAFSDYVRLIKSNPRYDEARAAGADPVRFAEALQAAGYATDPGYARKIRAIIESEPMAEARRLLGGMRAGTST
jgi:flagellar protein FlgJ